MATYVEELNRDWTINALYTCNNKKRIRQKDEVMYERPDKIMKLDDTTTLDSGMLETPSSHLTLDSRMVETSNSKDPQELLLAYKRIWNSLDLNKVIDAKLEPFIWNKIRQYQQMLKQQQ